MEVGVKVFELFCYETEKQEREMGIEQIEKIGTMRLEFRIGVIV